MTLHGDTIAAIATAPGRGGVAVVRVSGPEAFHIAEALTGKPPTPGRIAVRKIYGVIVEGESTSASSGMADLRVGRDPSRGQQPAAADDRARLSHADNNPVQHTKSSGMADDNNPVQHTNRSESNFLQDESVRPHIIICGLSELEGNRSSRILIDECVVLAFRAPHSYTGEDVVEFQCHGGTVTPRRILEACFAAGARLAERGEFTARAFLSGRISLDAAEGVIELVDAKTDRAADAALARLGGECAKRHRALYETALDISTSLEHTLDVDESDLPIGFIESLKFKVQSLREEISIALAKLREGKILRDGARVVLAGAPNAGKSSLLNALLGENRAIVSATPGTTRDSIEEWLDIGGWPVRLTDTAGLRGTSDAIEAEGVARANDLIAKADLVIALDCDIPGALRVHAKCDLDEGAGGLEGLESLGVDGTPKRPNAQTSKHPNVQTSTPLPVSAKTGEGLAELRHAIAARLEEKSQKFDELSGDNEREAALLTEALASLSTANYQLPTANCPLPTADLVLLANAVRTCAETLGRLVGAVYSDDLLDALFSRFCVGK